MIPISKDQNINNIKFYTENAMKKTYISRIIKLSIKAKNTKKVLLNL